LFEWQAFLDDHRIEYEVQKGGQELAIFCPWCGFTIKSRLAINTLGKGWHCWRDTQHVGRSPVRLVAQLAGISYAEAAALTGVNVPALSSDFASQVRAMLEPSQVAKEPPSQLALLPEFKEFKPSTMAKPFYEYLKGRGFSSEWITNRSTSAYGLRWCVHGKFRYRIIFPIRHNKQLVNWTGRTIAGADLRYLTLSADEDAEPRAVGPITNYLLWYDQLAQSKSDTLVICEGPFDALKVRYLGRSQGITATCLFTAGITEAQKALLYDLVPRFKRTFLLLDSEMWARAENLASDLTVLGIKTVALPPHVNDPGELNTLWFIKSA